MTTLRREEDEYLIDFDNPRQFVIGRWHAAIDSNKLSDADQRDAAEFGTAETFQNFVRMSIKKARDEGQKSFVNPLITMSALHGSLWEFEQLIIGLDDEQDPTGWEKVSEVDVRPLWGMAYLNIKLSLASVDKLKRTAAWMNDYRRQIDMLIAALKQASGDNSPLRIEMSEIFEPALGALYDSISYLQRHHFDDKFVQNWYSSLQPKIKAYLEQMEGTVRHIRAMGVTRRINQLQELRRAEMSIREREYPMDGSEKAIFPVDNLPDLKTDFFTGRTKEMQKIHNWLGAADNKRLRTYLIYGRRGIGKTQIALEYSARYGQSFDAIFWIQCETSASLRQSFADIATSLELDGADKNGHFEENLMKVNKWLRYTDKRWLLIYDNAERENLLKGFWPVGARGTILLTSRTYYNFFEDDQRQGETVPNFTPDESYESLMAQLGDKWQATHLTPTGVMYDVEKVAAQTLLKETGGLPLAIKHAARLILNKNIGMTRPGGRGDDSIHGFLELFDDSSKNLPPRPSGPRDQTIHSLDTIWSIAFDALSSNAQSILQVLALVSPDVILIQLFQPSDQARLTGKLSFCKVKELPNTLRPSIETIIVNSEELQLAVEELVRQGMVTRTGRSMAIHREVQEAVNYKAKEDLRDAFDAAVNLLYDAFPQQKEGRPMSEDKETCRQWVQHVIALAARYKSLSLGKEEKSDPLQGIGSTELFVKLIANCSWYLFEIADYDECLNMIGIGRGACKDKNSLDYAHLMNTEGTTFYELNKLTPSRAAYEIAQIIRETQLPEGHAEIAIIKANLGNVESALGKYPEALELLEDAAHMRERIGDEAAELLALNYMQLGRVHFLEKRFDQAYREYQKCEGVLMKKVGRNRWFLADLYYAYGNLEFARREWALSYRTYERARRICQELNPLHPLTASVYYKMGCTDFKLNRLTKAMGNLEKALNIAELRSPNAIDGSIARIQWKRAEVVLNDPTAGPERYKEFQDLMADMDLRLATIAESMDIEILGMDDDVQEREKMFDLLVAGYYR